jgi:hypothetical protein
MIEKVRHKTEWTIHKFNDPDGKIAEALKAGKSIEEAIVENLDSFLGEEIFADNILLNEGINEIWNLVIGASANHFDNANAQIGVGDGGLTALTGTLTFTNGSATVTGTGTAFTTEVAADYWIQLDADGVLYQVKSVESDTSLTLKRLYAETGGSGAGSKISPTETDLAGTNTAYVGMDAGYPSVSAQKVSFRSTFDTATGNFAWEEFTVKQSISAINLNRKVISKGTKASGETWTVTLEITLS